MKIMGKKDKAQKDVKPDSGGGKKAEQKPGIPEERLSKIEKQLAEIRSAIMESDKDKDDFKASVSKAMNAVNAARPEKLLAEMQKRDGKISGLESKVNGLAKTSEQLAKDLNGLKSRVANSPDKGQMEEIKKILKEKADAMSGAPKGDQKAMKEFLNRSGSIEADIGTLKVRFDKLLNVIDMSTERLGAVQKDISAMKQAKPAKGSGQGIPPELTDRIAAAEKSSKDLQGLEGRVEDIEELLEKISARPEGKPASAPSSTDMKEMRAVIERIMKLEAAMKDLKGMADASKGKPGISQAQVPMPPELKDVRTLLDRMGRMESSVKDMRERLASMDEDIAKAAEQKSQPAPEPAADIQPVNERLNSVDSRITGMSDRLMRLGEDCQKLSDYFMEGMKHMDEKIRGMESLVKAEDKVISSLGSKPVELFTPTTYRSHLKRPIPDDYETDPAPARPSRPAARPQETRPLAAFPALPQPAPVMFPENLPAALPQPPAPPRGNMFTKLRNGTVERRPYPQQEPDSDDVEIIMEHITESMRRRESRDKITRDLLNAGYDIEIIDRAFMQARVG